MGCAYCVHQDFQRRIQIRNVTTHVGLVPLSEWGCIDLDDSALDEGVGTDQLVVGSIVHLRTIKVSILRRIY